MFQKNCLFLQVDTCNPAQLPPLPHKTSTAGGLPPPNQSDKDIFLKYLLTLVGDGTGNFCSTKCLQQGIPFWKPPWICRAPSPGPFPARFSPVPKVSRPVFDLTMTHMVLIPKPTLLSVSSLNHMTQKKPRKHKNDLICFYSPYFILFAFTLTILKKVKVQYLVQLESGFIICVSLNTPLTLIFH